MCLKVLFLCGPERQRRAGHFHWQKLRQVWNRGARAGARGRILARAHPPGQRRTRGHLQGEHLVR